MGLIPLQLQAGIFADLTPFAAKNRYVMSNKVRFQYRLAQTMGGCINYNAAIQFDGVPRAIKVWSTLAGTQVIGVGTHKKCELLISGAKSDVTPFQWLQSGTLGTDPFTTSSGSATVTVAHTSHGLITGDAAMFANAGTLNGVNISQLSWIITKVDANSYTITCLATATGSGSGGGSTVTYQYDARVLGSNPFTTTSGSKVVSVADTGHALTAGCTVFYSNMSSFNSVNMNGTWEVAGVTDANNYTITYTSNANGSGAGGGSSCRAYYCIVIGATNGVSMRLPALQPWGQDLLFTLGSQSGIYRWNAATPSVRALQIPTAPLCNFILLSPDDQSLIAFGINGDPKHMSWANEADYTDWQEIVTTTAGDIEVLRGSKLVAACNIQGGNLIFTDTAVHLMTFIGGDFVFSIAFLDNTAIMGQNAWAVKEGQCWWMANGQFYVYDGRVQSLDCTCRRYVFSNLNAAEYQGVYGGVNDEFNEVMFFYTSSAATYNDSYIHYNYLENPWCIGTWQRTAWIDDTPIQSPLALDASGNLYQHETGTSDNGVALNASLTSGEMDSSLVGDPGGGDQVLFLRRAVLDAAMAGNYNFSVLSRPSNADAYTISGPILVAAGVREVYPRARNRRMAFQWSTPTYTLEALAREAPLSDFITTEDGQQILCDGIAQDQTLNLATFWRLGVQEPDVALDGHR